MLHGHWAHAKIFGKRLYLAFLTAKLFYNYVDSSVCSSITDSLMVNKDALEGYIAFLQLADLQLMYYWHNDLLGCLFSKIIAIAGNIHRYNSIWYKCREKTFNYFIFFNLQRLRHTGMP